MAGFMNELDNKNFVIRLQWVFIAILFVITIFAIVGWTSVQRDVTIHVPPDLRTGANLKPGEVPLPNIYTFTQYIWQQVNRWTDNGDKDYGAAIYKLQAFLTPSCRINLESDLNQKSSAGELTLRTRFIQEITGHGYSDTRVIPTSKDSWHVTLDTEIFETVRGIRVKDTYVRYPMRVVRFEGDREANPFGLALDCFSGSEKPSRIDHEIAEERRKLEESLHARSAAGGRAGELQNTVTKQ